MSLKIGSKYRYADLYPLHRSQFASVAGLSPAQLKEALWRAAQCQTELAH